MSEGDGAATDRQGQAGDAMVVGAETISRIPLLVFTDMRPVPPPDGATYSVAMDIGPNNMNLMGVAHGGAVATLIDHAGGHASSILIGRAGPTADLHIRYLAGAKPPWIRADAVILRAGARIVVIEVRVFDSEGTLVALGTLSVAPRSSPGTMPPDG